MLSKLHVHNLHFKEPSMRKILGVVCFLLIFLSVSTIGAQNSLASASPRAHAYYDDPSPNDDGDGSICVKGICPPFPTCPTAEPCRNLNPGLDAKTRP